MGFLPVILMGVYRCSPGSQYQRKFFISWTIPKLNGNEGPGRDIGRKKSYGGF
jgi:hypothetical protein